MNKRGFTLIELLVVVLIIGILAAIALPMYTKTVEKSRMTEALLNAKSLAESEVRHFLETDSYVPATSNADLSSSTIALDMYAPASTKFAYTGHNITEVAGVADFAVRATRCNMTTGGETTTCTAATTGPQNYEVIYTLLDGEITGRYCASTDAATCSAVSTLDGTAASNVAGASSKTNMYPLK